MVGIIWATSCWAATNVFPLQWCCLCQWKFWSRKRARGQDGVVGERSKRMDGENVGQWVATVESENWVKLSENERRRFFFAHRVSDGIKFTTTLRPSSWSARRLLNLPCTIGVQSTMMAGWPTIQHISHCTQNVQGARQHYKLLTDGVGIEFNTWSHHHTIQPPTNTQVFTSVRGAADLVFGLGYAESYGAAAHTNLCVCFFYSLTPSMFSNPNRVTSRGAAKEQSFRPAALIQDLFSATHPRSFWSRANWDMHPNDCPTHTKKKRIIHLPTKLTW